MVFVEDRDAMEVAGEGREEGRDSTSAARFMDCWGRCDADRLRTYKRRHFALMESETL